MPDYFEWRIESRAPNGFTKFLPFGDPKNYLTNDEHIEALSSLKVDQWGNCLEASIEALVNDLPNGHLGAVNVCAVSIRYAETGNWTDIYAGVVTSPGAPNDFEMSRVNLLGLKKRLYETVVPPRFGVVTNPNTDPWTVDANQDGRTGDVGQVIRNIVASVINQLGGNGATLSKVLTGIPAITGYTITVDPNFNSAGELIDKILETILAVANIKAIWGVNGKREVFVVMPGGALSTLAVDGRDIGTDVQWNDVDSSKVVSAVRWVGFTTDRDSWSGFEHQNFVSHESQGDQSYGYSAIRENIPENMITGIVAQTDVDGIRFRSTFTGTVTVTLPYVAASDSFSSEVFIINAFDGGAGTWSRVDGVRVNAEVRKKTDSIIVLNIVRMDGGSGTIVESIDLLDGDHDYWFSGHRAADGTQQYATKASIRLFDYNSANYKISTFEFLALDTPLLDRIAESRYRFPAPDACTITVEGQIIPPEPLVQITWAISDTESRTVTRSAESYEYKITAGGYPVTVIQVGQARDANELAVWAEIKSRDRRATANANSYAPRGR